MIFVESEGLSICNNCSKTMKYLIENEKPSYKEPPKEVCFYAYKRINHFNEWLAQFHVMKIKSFFQFLLLTFVITLIYKPYDTYPNVL